MAVTTALVAVAAGATIASSQAQKKAAKQAGAAFDGVGSNLGNVDNVETGIRSLMGSTEENQRYEKMRDAAAKTINSQQAGELSDATKRMLAMRAVDSGAAGLGGNAVGDNYAAYLGISQEQLAQQGLTNYREYLAQLTQTTQSAISNNYAQQYNAAAVKAGVAQQKGAATAGMWQGIASIAGGVAGGGFGSAGAAAGGAAVKGGAGI